MRSYTNGIYIRILLQMLESSVSLLITMKPTTRENFRLAAILLYYILQKYCLSGSLMFPQILLWYVISCPKRKWL